MVNAWPNSLECRYSFELMISTASVEVRTGTISKSTKSRQFVVHLSNRAKSFSLHKLPAGFETQINPAGNVFQSLRHHSAPLSEASVNFGCTALFETLDDHVKHGSSVVAGVPPAISNCAAGTAASCILAFQPLGCKTERLRDPGCLGFR